VPFIPEKVQVIKKTDHEHDPTKYRRFERVDIAVDAGVEVLDSSGEKIGMLRQLGRGGFMMESEESYSKDGNTHEFILYEPQEDIRATVNARVLYADNRTVGLEFVDLDPDNAVELGIIIGKYYEAGK
jgi:hypothetical protein